MDHSAETTAREVYVAACEERGVVPNTRATRGLAMSSCDLAHAGLGDANVEAVGVALQSGALATSLNLRDNDASEIGFERLAHGLMDNARLVRLDCSDNPGPGARRRVVPRARSVSARDVDVGGVASSLVRIDGRRGRRADARADR